MTEEYSSDVSADLVASLEKLEPRLLRRSHLYHMTYTDELYSILRHGIQPSETSHRDSLESALLQVAEKFNLEFPIDRRECVYLYPRIQDALAQLPAEDIQKEHATLYGSQEVVVVNGTETDQPLYIGEFQLISDAIDFQYKDEPDDTMISESFEDALRRYAAGLTTVESLTALPTLCEEYELPEVLVENGLGPEVIVGWESFPVE